MNASAAGRWRAMISFEEWPARVRRDEGANVLGGVRDGPGHELVRLLRIVTVPLEEALRTLRVSARPVVQLARCLGMDLGPVFERYGARRRGGRNRRRGLLVGVGRRRLRHARGA